MSDSIKTNSWFSSIKEYFLPKPKLLSSSPIITNYLKDEMDPIFDAAQMRNYNRMHADARSMISSIGISVVLGVACKYIKRPKLQLGALFVSSAAATAGLIDCVRYTIHKVDIIEGNCQISDYSKYILNKKSDQIKNNIDNYKMSF